MPPASPPAICDAPAVFERFSRFLFGLAGLAHGLFVLPLSGLAIRLGDLLAFASTGNGSSNSVLGSLSDSLEVGLRGSLAPTAVIVDNAAAVVSATTGAVGALGALGDDTNMNAITALSATASNPTTNDGG